MRPARVLFDLTLPYRVGGGTGTFGFGLLRALRARPEVDVITVAASRRRSPIRSRWRRLARSLREAAWIQTAVPARALTAGVDLVHAPSFLAPAWCPRPLVVTLFDTLYLRYPAHYPPLWLAYFKAAVAAAVRRAAAVATISEASRLDIIAAYGVEPDRVHVTYPGVESPFAAAPEADEVARVRRVHGLDRPYVLHVGSLVERKNVPRLVEAFAALKRDGLPHRLVLAGAGNPGMPGRSAVAERIDRLGIGDAVRLLGFVPAADLPALYAGASAVAVPSLAEGFGFPVLEAMAAGVPVATSNGSSLAEVAGDAALLFDPLDPAGIAVALRRLLTDEPLRTALVERGRIRVRGFTWGRTAAATLRVYEAALGHPPARAG